MLPTSQNEIWNSKAAIAEYLIIIIIFFFLIRDFLKYSFNTVIRAFNRIFIIQIDENQFVLSKTRIKYPCRKNRALPSRRKTILSPSLNSLIQIAGLFEP